MKIHRIIGVLACAAGVAGIAVSSSASADTLSPLDTILNSVQQSSGVTAPGAPAAPAASPGDGSALVTVTGPSAGGLPTTYLIQASPGGAACSFSGSAGDCTVTGLANGTAYTFTALAINGGGPSPVSPASNSVTPSALTSEPSVPSGTPSAPSGSIARPGSPGKPTVVAGNATARVTVVAPASGGAVTSYTVTAHPGGRSCKVAGKSSSCVVTGLTNGKSYTFTATASNAAGTSASSATSKAVTPRLTAPGKPTQVKAVAGNGSASVSWFPGTGLTNTYTVTASPGGHSCFVNIHLAGQIKCVVTGLTNGTKYTFKVTATNSAGTSSVVSNNVTPAKPASGK
jgi:hypothetical protein